MVPSFLLQPLVENAVRHGVAPRTEPGRVEVRVDRDGNRLRFLVDDDGPGIHNNGEGTGLGLSATRERLALRYGAHAILRCETKPGGAGRNANELPIELAPSFESSWPMMSRLRAAGSNDCCATRLASPCSRRAETAKRRSRRSSRTVRT